MDRDERERLLAEFRTYSPERLDAEIRDWYVYRERNMAMGRCDIADLCHNLVELLLHVRSELEAA